MNKNEKLGKIAYEAYCDSVGWRSAISGAKLPTWQDQNEQIKQAWCESACGVIKHFAQEVCKHAEHTIEKTHKIEGAHYMGMMSELEEVGIDISN